MAPWDPSFSCQQKTTTTKKKKSGPPRSSCPLSQAALEGTHKLGQLAPGSPPQQCGASGRTTRGDSQVRAAQSAGRAVQRGRTPNPAPDSRPREITRPCSVGGPAPRFSQPLTCTRHFRWLRRRYGKQVLTTFRCAPNLCRSGPSNSAPLQPSYNRTRWCQFVRLASSEHVRRSGTIPTLNPRTCARSNPATSRPNPHTAPCLCRCAAGSFARMCNVSEGAWLLRRGCAPIVTLFRGGDGATSMAAPEVRGAHRTSNTGPFRLVPCAADCSWPLAPRLQTPIRALWRPPRPPACAPACVASVPPPPLPLPLVCARVRVAEGAGGSARGPEGFWIWAQGC